MGRRREHPPRALGPRCTSAHFFLGCAHKGSSSSFVHVCPPTRAAPRAVLGDEMSPAPATAPCRGLCVYLPMKRKAPAHSWICGSAAWRGLRVYASGTPSVGPETACERHSAARAADAWMPALHPEAEDTAVRAPGGGPGTCISGRYPR